MTLWPEAPACRFGPTRRSRMPRGSRIWILFALHRSHDPGWQESMHRRLLPAGRARVCPRFPRQLLDATLTGAYGPWGTLICSPWETWPRVCFATHFRTPTRYPAAYLSMHNQKLFLARYDCAPAVWGLMWPWRLWFLLVGQICFLQPTACLSPRSLAGLGIVFDWGRLVIWNSGTVIGIELLPFSAAFWNAPQVECALLCRLMIGRASPAELCTATRSLSGILLVSVSEATFIYCNKFCESTCSQIRSYVRVAEQQKCAETSRECILVTRVCWQRSQSFRMV